ncbi:MAG: metalloregulator ArsR/SmtB family transcription factor [Candidatus Woesearchaeota archaeon]
MLKESAVFLRILGDETKLKIIRHLLKGEVCSCEFISVTGRAQSTVSTHLNDLEKENILKSRRKGRNIFYSIKDKRVYSICKLLGIGKNKTTKTVC